MHSQIASQLIPLIIRVYPCNPWLIFLIFFPNPLDNFFNKGTVEGNRCLATTQAVRVVGEVRCSLLSQEPVQGIELADTAFVPAGWVAVEGEEEFWVAVLHFP